MYLCACLSVCTLSSFIILSFQKWFRPDNIHNFSYTHIYCNLTRSYADQPLYYYLELLYFRYGLQFRLKYRSSSYFVICISKTKQNQKSTETVNTVQNESTKKRQETNNSRQTKKKLQKRIEIKNENQKKKKKNE